MPRISTRRPATSGSARTEYRRLHFMYLTGAAKASVFRKKARD